MTVPTPAAGPCGKHRLAHHMKPHMNHLSDFSRPTGSLQAEAACQAAQPAAAKGLRWCPKDSVHPEGSSCPGAAAAQVGSDPLALPRPAGGSATSARSQRRMRMAAATCVNLRDCRSASDDLKPGALFRCSQVMRWVPELSLPAITGHSTVHLVCCKLRSRHSASPALQPCRLDEARCQGEAATVPSDRDGALQHQSCWRAQALPSMNTRRAAKPCCCP